jgi:hypothetical protein
MSENKKASGGRKGGTQFPQISLKKAVEYAQKLVSKVHTGPQPETVILKGVFNSSGSDGRIRASALKQYDLMTGLSSAYDATDLARSIHSAPTDELPPLLARACLSPKVFKTLFHTFQQDTVSKAKIRQQVLQLKVHPESADKCVEIFVGSLLYSGLGIDRNGEVEISGGVHPKTPPPEAETKSENPGDEEPKENGIADEDKGGEGEPQRESTGKGFSAPLAAPKAQFQVALNLDTMDPEKLEKHMKILKRYGVIG